MDLAAVLGEVGAFLESEGVPFAVAGALALHAYGYSRVTSDVDLVLPAGAQDRLVGFLERRGFETLHRSAGYSNHLHPDAALGRLDAIYVDEGTWAKMSASARPAVMGGRDVVVPTPEHLVAMKVHAMKNDPSRLFREMADIQYLATLPGVDREEVRRYFVQAGLLERFLEIERAR